MCWPSWGAVYVWLKYEKLLIVEKLLSTAVIAVKDTSSPRSTHIDSGIVNVIVRIPLLSKIEVQSRRLEHDAPATLNQDA